MAQRTVEEIKADIEQRLQEAEALLGDATTAIAADPTDTTARTTMQRVLADIQALKELLEPIQWAETQRLHDEVSVALDPKAQIVVDIRDHWMKQLGQLLKHPSNRRNAWRIINGFQGNMQALAGLYSPNAQRSERKLDRNLGLNDYLEW